MAPFMALVLARDSPVAISLVPKGRFELPQPEGH